MEQNTKVTDFPLGLMMMLVAQFPVFGVSYLIGPTQWWVLPVVIILSYVYYIAFMVGFKIAFIGVEVHDDK